MFLVRPDGRIIDHEKLEDPSDHTDSSCYFIAGRALDHAACWLDIPKEFSIIGDRVYWLMLKNRGLKIAHIKSEGSRVYDELESALRAVGRTVPAER